MRKLKYAQWFDDDDLEEYNHLELPHGSKADYIRLHRLNTNPRVISLKCPHCDIFVQGLPLPNDSNSKYDRVAFMCYNYPRCPYPLNRRDYRKRFIWNNVVYVGPMTL